MARRVGGRMLQSAPVATGDGDYRTCANCGRPFGPNSPAHRYCSPRCRRIADRHRREQRDREAGR